MALTSTEEAQVRDLLAKQIALLTLANEEPAITSKLAADKVHLPDLISATVVNDPDLLLMRQGGVDKKVPTSLLPGRVLRDDLANTTTAGKGANLVKWSPSRTAVADSVEKALQDFAYFMGGQYLLTAVSGGVVDNTAVFQSLFSETGTNSKRWMLKPGTYRVNGQVTIADGNMSTLLGLSRNFRSADALGDTGSVALRTYNNGPAFFRPASSNTAFYQIKGIDFIGPSTSPTVSALSVAIKDLAHVVHVHISDCTFSYYHGGSTGGAVQFDQCFEGHFERLLFQYNQGWCLAIAGGTGNWALQIDCEANNGGGLKLGGDGVLMRPYFEFNCQLNNPAGENLSYREMLFTGGGVWSVHGARMVTHPNNNKEPVELIHTQVRFYDCPTPTHSSTYTIKCQSNGTDSRPMLVGCYGWSSDTTKLAVRLSAGYPGTEAGDLVLDGFSTRNLMAKARGKFRMSDMATIQAENLGSVVRLNPPSPVGAFRVTFASDTFSSPGAITPVVTCDSPVPCSWRVNNETLTSVDISFTTTDGTNTPVDPYTFSIVLFGV